MANKLTALKTNICMYTTEVRDMTPEVVGEHIPKFGAQIEVLYLFTKAYLAMMGVTKSFNQEEPASAVKILLNVALACYVRSTTPEVSGGRLCLNHKPTKAEMTVVVSLLQEKHPVVKMFTKAWAVLGSSDYIKLTPVSKLLTAIDFEITTISNLAYALGFPMIDSMPYLSRDILVGTSLDGGVVVWSLQHKGVYKVISIEDFCMVADDEFFHLPLSLADAEAFGIKDFSNGGLIVG